MAAPERQLELYEGPVASPCEQRRVVRRSSRSIVPLCAACRAKQARYGFRDEEGNNPPRTLCFECFRMEIERRQALARSENAEQAELPLLDVRDQADLRRRRAQIAARQALGIH